LKYLDWYKNFWC